MRIYGEEEETEAVDPYEYEALLGSGAAAGIFQKAAAKYMPTVESITEKAEPTRSRYRSMDYVFNPVAPNPVSDSIPSQYSTTYGTQGGGGLSGSYWDKMANIESGGDYNAHNKGSGAYGKYQFIPSTMKAYAKKLGITVEQARTPAGQDAMVKKFTADNAAGLRRAGIPVNDQTLYAAHQQGLGGAIALYKGGNVSKKNLESNGVGNTQEWMSKFATRMA